MSVTVGIAPMLVLAQPDWTREDRNQKIALDYIENARKSGVQIKVLDEVTGLPIEGALMSYRQVSHDFMFTIGGSPLDFMSELSLNALEVFPLNWTRIEPRDGDFHYEFYDRALDYWLKEVPHAQLFVKLWVVPEAGWVYKTWPPPYTRFSEILTNQSAFQEFLGHVYDYVYHSASHLKAIRYWITQMEINVPEYPINEAKKQLWTVQQAVEIDRVSARAIRDANPNATILLGTSNPNFMGEDPSLYADPVEFAKMCIRRGVAFDGVAIETWPYWTPADYYDYMGKLTALGKSVFIHEIQGFAAVPPGGRWLLSGRWRMFDEDSQAAWLKCMFTIAYGKSGVIGIYWLWYQDSPAYETGQAFPDGLNRLDGTPRKAYYTFRDLMKQFTTYGNGTTDANGILGFRGFAGHYSVTVTAKGFETLDTPIHVQEGKENSFVVRMKRPLAYTKAADILVAASSKLKEAENASFQSLVARSQLITARTEYEMAVQAFGSHSYDEAVDHCRKSLALVEGAFAEEQAYQEQRLARQERQLQEQQQQIILLASVSAAIAATVAATILYEFRRIRSRQRKQQQS